MGTRIASQYQFLRERGISCLLCSFCFRTALKLMLHHSPEICSMDHLLHLVHVKILAADLLSLTIQHTSPPAFLRFGRTVARAELVGIVVSRDRRDKFLSFVIDDGTGCVPCILWLNHQYLNAGQSEFDPTAEMAMKMSEEVRLGSLLRVRGKIATYRGAIQITVRDLVVEKDPNSEVLHWLQCVRLAKECYDLPPPSAQDGT